MLEEVRNRTPRAASWLQRLSRSPSPIDLGLCLVSGPPVLLIRPSNPRAAPGTEPFTGDGEIPGKGSAARNELPPTAGVFGRPQASSKRGAERQLSSRSEIGGLSYLPVPGDAVRHGIDRERQVPGAFAFLCRHPEVCDVAFLADWLRQAAEREVQKRNPARCSHPAGIGDHWAFIW